jgi:polysaccharide biosynthesis protein PslG
VTDGSRFGRRPRIVAAAVVAVVAGAVAGVLLLTGGGDDDPAPRPPVARPAPPAPEPEPSPPEPAGPSIGVSVNWLFNGDTFTAAQVEEQLDAMQADGVKLARTDAFWGAAEPQAPAGGEHRYDWAFADRVAGSLASHGLTWLPIIAYSAPWAASVPGNDKGAPTSADDYAAYARAFTERYGREGRFWAERPELPPAPVTTIEIWNEPDNSEFWAPAPDPAAYIDLYLKARAAIREADPRARVLIGGLTGAPTFLPQLLAARPDARGQVDGVAVHTYSPEPLGALAEARDARRTLVSLGMADVPLWVTEFGWVSRPRNSDKYATPAERPGHIASTTSALAGSDCGIDGVVLYAWITPSANPRAEGDWYGLRARDGGPTASSRAFARAVAQAARPPQGPAAALCAQP